LLKWIGRNSGFAHEIAGYFPEFKTYFDRSSAVVPFWHSRTRKRYCRQHVCRHLSNLKRCASPDKLKAWYAESWQQIAGGERVEGYDGSMRAQRKPEWADLLFLLPIVLRGRRRFLQKTDSCQRRAGFNDPSTRNRSMAGR